MIAFSRPAVFGAEVEYLSQVRDSRAPWGGGEFYAKASAELRDLHHVQDVLLTQSCTAALELAALGLNVGPGDEVVIPSYTFVSTANAFALRGAKIVFADSEPETLNMDAAKLEQLITEKTKAIVVVHYGGVACEMDEIMAIAQRYGVPVVEDAAQAIGATYKGRPLGSIGDLGCLSFHGTKNVSSGEGGALMVNSQDEDLLDRIHTAHEKGTDRAKFLRGEVDKYTWRQLGSSFIPSEFTSAILLAQLQNFKIIQSRRKSSWEEYASALTGIQEKGFGWLKQGTLGSNFHMFALISPDGASREHLRKKLREKGVIATSHYEPLHSSPFAAGQNWPKADVPVAQDLSERILRLPMWSEEGLETALVTSAIISVLKSAQDQK